MAVYVSKGLYNGNFSTICTKLWCKKTDGSGQCSGAVPGDGLHCGNKKVIYTYLVSIHVEPSYVYMFIYTLFDQNKTKESFNFDRIYYYVIRFYFTINNNKRNKLLTLFWAFVE